MIKKLKQTIRDQLAQGLTPESVTRAVLVGAAISVFPVLGVTTPIGIVLATVWKLSHVIVQGVNYLLYPLQLALIPVFAALGEWILGREHTSMNPIEIIETWKRVPFGEFISRYGSLGLSAVLGWAVVVPLVVIVANQGVKRWVSKLRS